MKGKQRPSEMARRSFLARVGMGVGLAGTAAISGRAEVIRSTAGAGWEPARHAQDDWLEHVPSQHRFVVDTTSPDGLSLACQFTHSYLAANREEYGLQPSDLAVLVVLRHRSTPFGFTDAMWKKYGKQLSQQAEFTDPETGRPFLTRIDELKDRAMTSVHLRNIYAGGSPGTSGPMVDLIKNGVYFAVCKTSTRNICASIAQATGAKSERVLDELSANLIPNARLVSAGIVIVNRAQERGYSYVHTL